MINSKLGNLINEVFLSVPVQGNRLTSQVYEKLMNVINQLGMHILNTNVLHPPKPSDIYRYSASEIYFENLNLLKNSELLIAEISSPSLGIGYEIATAERFLIPIICVYQRRYKKYISLMIRGIFYEKIKIIEYTSFKELEILLISAVEELIA